MKKVPRHVPGRRGEAEEGEMSAQRGKKSPARLDIDAEIERVLNRVLPASAALSVMGELNGEAKQLEDEARVGTNRAILAAFQLRHEREDLTDDERSLLLVTLEASSARRDELTTKAERLRARGRSYSDLADKAPGMSRRSGLAKQEMGG
jgi:hypothetical protein